MFSNHSAATIHYRARKAKSWRGESLNVCQCHRKLYYTLRKSCGIPNYELVRTIIAATLYLGCDCISRTTTTVAISLITCSTKRANTAPPQVYVNYSNVYIGS